MKKLTILIFALLFTQLTAWSQPCLPEGITFSTQEEIDNFQTNYPNCTEIEGDVLIGMGYSGSSNITNLIGLNVLTSIGGEFRIKHNDILVGLTGLDNLTFIGDILSIRFNESLSSFTGLEGLTTIGGMFIGDNESLSSLTGLEDLTTINAGITIDGNDALTSLTGLNNVTFIGGSLEIYWNTALTSFTGLDNVTSIEGELYIVRNSSLTSLTGLESLTTIDGDVYISCNNALTSLMGIDNIEAGSIGDLYINNNPSLSECEVQSICNYLVSPNGTIDIFGNAIGCNSTVEIANACGITLPCLPYGNYYFYTQEQIDNFQTDYPNCTVLNGNVLIRGDDINNLNGFNVLVAIGGDLKIYDNPALTSLSGLENLTSIGGSLQIGYINWGMPFPTTFHNPLLSSLYALNSLSYINGDLSIVCNDSLTSLTGLEGLTSIGGGTSIMYNNSLTSLNGLENLTSIEGNLIIGDRYFGNASLLNLSGLEGLTTIGGGVGICSNASMTSLTGLENLTSVGGGISIGSWTGEAGNASLLNLTGLEGLTSIEGGFGIYSNESMTSLTGLQNLTSIEGYLEIRRNPTLASLSGLENIEAYSITDLDIRNNSVLSSCDVQSICDYLVNPNGEIHIWGNAPGCNSPEEIEDICFFSCLPEGINLYSQAEIDSFPSNYPDCVNIDGNVIISGEDIFNLNGLNGLKYFGGNLEISANNMLSSLTGLEAIKMISGDLSISENDLLSSLSGLNNISHINENLLVTSNETLSNLSGLNNLAKVGGSLEVSENDELAGLSELQTTNSIVGSLNIIGNDIMTDIWGLENINSASIEELHIFNNTSLSECDIQSVCEYITSPGAVIQIYNNAAGCNSLEEVEEACENHCFYEGITFNTQAEINSFQINYPLCSEIDGNIKIKGDDITNLNGLNNLILIGGNLKIINNHSLLSLTGFDSLTFIEEGLFIDKNNLLTSLTGLESLAVINNGGLTIGTFATGGGNPKISNLTGLNNLSSINGGLHISFNNELTSLYGIEDLSAIDGELEIQANAALTNISGLNNINPGSIDSLTIVNNTALSNCAIQSICSYLSNPNAIVWIENNETNCNNPEEVIEACELSVSELNFENTFIISPNPSSSAMRIRFTIYEQGFTICDLFEVSGVKVKSILNEEMLPANYEKEIDLSYLKPGIYFCVLKTNSCIQTKKIIKL